jgi:hypothetical protein
MKGLAKERGARVGREESASGFSLSRHRASMSCLQAWEAKIKAEKKRRRPPSRSQNLNPAANAKCSRPPRRSRANPFTLPSPRTGIGRAVYVHPESPASLTLFRRDGRSLPRARVTHLLRIIISRLPTVAMRNGISHLRGSTGRRRQTLYPCGSPRKSGISNVSNLL